MPDIDTMKNSPFLKKEDVGQGLTVTINRMEQDTDDKGEPRWLLFFSECQKPLWSNSTHREVIAANLGSRNSDDWPGKQITLFNNLDVIYNGKQGAIRVRGEGVPHQYPNPQMAGGTPQQPIPNQPPPQQPQPQEAPPQGFANKEDPGY